jgi:hypothetical protein
MSLHEYANLVRIRRRILRNSEKLPVIFFELSASEDKVD